MQIKEHCADADAEVRHAVDTERAIRQMAQAKAMRFVGALYPALHRPLPYFSTLKVHVVTL
jgi:hypothetical protein